MEAVGDVDSALSDYYAERVRATADKTGVSERVIRQWANDHLITEHGIRGQVLQEPERSQGLDNRAIWSLVNAHLVRAEKRRGMTWFELAHDRLVEPIRKNNAEWFKGNLNPLQLHAELWERRDRPDDLLLRGDALLEVQRWADEHPDDLTRTERDFLHASRELQRRTELERRNTRRIRALAIVATMFSVVALIGSVAAVVGWVRS